jgi:hypothetical protein
MFFSGFRAFVPVLLLHCFILFYLVVLLLFLSFYVLFVSKCVLYYCHRVTKQSQLTNISYIVFSSRHLIFSVFYSSTGCST